MRFRSDTAALAADSAERVSGLLAHVGGGWVPPEDDEDGPVIGPADPPAADSCGELLPRSWADEPGAATRALPAWLPAAVRNGRFDPGRRGAVALVVVALLAAVVAGGLVLRGRPQEVVVPAVLDAGVPLPGTTAAPAAEQPEVVVAVAGLVVRPGLVRLPAGSRVADALAAVGGPTPGASTDLLNLARKLVDGEQVLVGVDPPPGAATPSAAAAQGGPLDLNAASVSDLDALPGIGPVLAQRIVDWRTDNDRFDSVEQLREVTGIGDAKPLELPMPVTHPMRRQSSELLVRSDELTWQPRKPAELAGLRQQANPCQSQRSDQ